MTCDPKSLLQIASCFRCLPKPELTASIIYVLCRWANAQECDQDALNFLETIGISPDSTEGRAVCTLVSDLKNYPASGTKYWDRETIIYPMVGTTYDQQRVNLRNPGTYDFVRTNIADGLFTVNGVKGSPATLGYLDSQFVPNTSVAPLGQDNFRVMWYVDELPSAATQSIYFGSQGAGGAFAVRALSTLAVSTRNFFYDVNRGAANANSAVSGVPTLGIKFCQRPNATSMQSSYNATAWDTVSPSASTGLSAFRIYLLALNSNGGPTLYSNCRLSGFSLGEKLSDAELIEYRDIWDKFETALGRGHP